MRKRKDPSPSDESEQKCPKEEEIKPKFQEFLDRVEALGITYYTVKDPPRCSWDKRESDPCDPYLFLEWETGGIRGGSCWDTGEGHDPHRPYTTDNPEPEFTDLDKILEDVCPNINFLKYKTLASKVITYSSRTQNEYYGNHTSYMIKKLDLTKLYDGLSELGFLDD